MTEARMKNGKLKKTALLALLWSLVALIALTGATLAWFSFTNTTNVEPMSSAVSSGDASLGISNTQNGEFSDSCTLAPQDVAGALKPVSTSTLGAFFASGGQTPDGIAIAYSDVSGNLGDYLIHGTLYLQSRYDACDVYFSSEGMNFGADDQALAALRLALKITTSAGEKSYIFRLDDLGNTAAAASRRTVPESGTVVSSAENGNASYVSDPSTAISAYFALGSAESPTAGESALFSLAADETAQVEYWLYLEGCDDNCTNDVQNRQYSIQLGFAGVSG
jgi:hypothetical protein